MHSALTIVAQRLRPENDLNDALSWYWFCLPKCLIDVVTIKTTKTYLQDEKTHAAKAHDFRFWCMLLGIALTRFRNSTFGGLSVDSRKDPWFTK